ncbi:MAG: PilZ domain-containing protein [Desulfobacterales bacterium]|nr:PilZ domain-containing protein [Desulfobacterales bacterium]
MDEKRALQRFALELPVRMVSTANGREKITLFTSNICSIGAFIRADQPYPVGTDLEMEIFLLSDLPGKDDVIQVRGRVVRTEDAGMAVCFDETYQIQPCEHGCRQ